MEVVCAGFRSLWVECWLSAGWVCVRQSRVGGCISRDQSGRMYVQYMLLCVYV